MNLMRIAMTALLLLFSLQAAAQDVGMDDSRSKRQLMKMGLFPPDIIMRHQQTLGITQEQRGKMLKLVRSFQDEVAELQWNLQNEQQIMRKSLAAKDVDAQEALPQVERVLQMESEFKLAHFRLLIAIKNELTDEQIRMIRERMRQARS